MTAAATALRDEVSFRWRWPDRAALVVLLAIALALSVRATREGLGVGPDPAAYIGAARNLLAGRGLSVPGELLTGGGGRAVGAADVVSPLVNFPPVYPLMLAAGGAVRADPYETARWISVVSLLAMAALLYAGIRHCSGGRVWPAALGAAVFVLAPPTVQLHLFANSEPPFLVLQALSLLFIAEHVARPRRPMLIAAAACAALATGTRFVGVAGVAAGLAALLLMSRRRPSARLRDAVVFAACSLGPVVIWSLGNRYVTGTATNREWALHPVTPAQVRQAADLVSMWFVPEAIPRRWRWLAMALVGGLAVAASAVALRRRRDQRGADGNAIEARSKLDSRPLLPVVALFAAAYLLLVLISISFFDAATPLDDRILFPVFAAVTFGLPVLLSHLAHSVGATWARRGGRAVAFATTVSVAAVAVDGTDDWLKGRRVGLDYASPRWRASEVAAYVRGLPADRPVYTNSAYALFFLTGRNCYWIPRKWHTWSLKPNPAFAHDMNAMRARLTDRAAAIAYFERVRHRSYLASVEELHSTIPLQRVAALNDGAVYARDTSASP